MLLTRLLDTLRELGGQRPAHADEARPPANGSTSERARAVPRHDEFADLLDAIGAIDSDHGPGDQLALRDATIAELRGMLVNLRGIGDTLAWTEQERLRLLARVAELERAAAVRDARAARRERELVSRQALVARERKRHAATRAKLAERERVAAERWRELQALRRELRRLRLVE
jgi:hypothetical protein